MFLNFFQRYEHLLRWPRRRHYFRRLRKIETQRRDGGLKSNFRRTRIFLTTTLNFCLLRSNWWFSVKEPWKEPDLQIAPTPPLCSLSLSVCLEMLGVSKLCLGPPFLRKPCLHLSCFDDARWRWMKRKDLPKFLLLWPKVVSCSFAILIRNLAIKVFRCWFKLKC